jgi:F1F0 ATPase subunit 2
MNELFLLLIIMIAGLVLGIIFFGGLWWTVNIGLKSKNPAAWFILSFFIRISIVLVGFYFIIGGRWERLVACLLGFLIARVSITQFVKIPSEEAGHAP